MHKGILGRDSQIMKAQNNENMEKEMENSSSNDIVENTPRIKNNTSK